MKKIKYIALGAFATLLSSCGNDWLDLQSSTAIETDGSLTELRDFEFVLNGAYSSMQSSSYYGADMFCYGDLRGDDMKSYKSSSTNVSFTVPQPLHPQHPLATCGTTHPGRQPQHYGNRRAYRLQQFQLSQQMFPGNVRLPSLGICGENAEINLSIVPFQQDCCHLKGIQGYFCSIILKEP